MKTLDPLDGTQQLSSPAAEPQPTELQLQTGDMVQHYRVLRPLGRGGMAEVYLARDTQLGRKVALKLIHRDLQSSLATEQLVREARTTARFNHPNIVAIHAVGQWHGQPYLALEYVAGQSLAARLRQERPSPRQALRYGEAIAAALVAAHARQVLHRDLKPDNVLLGQDGGLRVLDFGISKSLAVGHDEASNADAELPSLTGWRGTPAYMAPEQWRGEATTPATDVWALGVMLWEMLAGAHPFRPHDAEGDSAATKLRPEAIARRVTQPEPAPPLPRGPEISESLVELVAACLHKAPQERPSALEVARGLDAQLAGTAETVEHDCPFPGLLPFTAARQRYFHGRQAELDGALERLRDSPLLPVVGPSGVGKSSFVRAGLLPRWTERGSWTVLELRPGRDPFRALATRLLEAAGETTGPRDAGDPITALAAELDAQPLRLGLELRRLAVDRGATLLSVDQAEEAFTLAGTQVAERFFEALLGAADEGTEPIRVIFTLREDFLHRLPPSPALRSALAQLTVLGAPSPAALATILERPIALAGYRYDDPTLPAEMVAAVGLSPTSLPLLSFTLRELWQRRDRADRLLRRADYEALGGVEGAVTRHADGVLAALPSEQRDLVRALCLRLVDTNDPAQAPPEARLGGESGGLAQGRLISDEELLSGLPSGARQVLERLIEARLLVVRQSAEATGIELSHDALIARWDRLRGWIEQSHGDLRLLAELRQSAALWQQRGRVDSEVWQGRPLDDALACLGRWPDARVGVVEAFVRFGEARRARARWRRNAWVGGGIGVAATTVLVALLVALAFAHRQRLTERERQRADAERRVAVSQRARAEREAARAAYARGDFLLGKALLRTALEAEDSTLARALWWRLSQEPQLWRRELGAFLYDAALSPSDEQLAVASQDGGVYLFDRRRGRLDRVLRGHRDQVFSVTYAPDGASVAAGAWNGEVRLWRLPEGVEERRIVAHRGAVWSVCFDAAGRRILSAGGDGTLALFDRTDGRELVRLRGHRGAVARAVFAPDGASVASAGYDGTVRLWDPSSGRERWKCSPHRGVVPALAFDREGRRLASGGTDGRIVILRLTADAVHRERSWAAHAGGVLNVAFTRGGRLVSSGMDGTVRSWERDGRPRRVYRGHRGPVDALALSRQGLAITASRDKTVRAWRLTQQAPAAGPREQAHGDAVYGLRFGPRGQRLASASMDGTVRLWDVASGRSPPALRGHVGQVYAVAFSPDGRLLASGGRDRTVRLWSLPEGQALRVVAGHEATIRALDFSPDGRLLASASDDRTVRLWDVPSARLRATLRGHASQLRDVRFAPDGQRLASAGWQGELRLWTRAGQPLARLAGPTQTLRTISWRADGTLAAAGDGGRIWSWAPGARRSRTIALAPAGRIYGLAWAGADVLMLGDSRGRLRRVVTGTGQVQTLARQRGEINAIAVDPARDLLATSGDDHTVRLVDLATGRPRWRAGALLQHAGTPWRSRPAGWQPLAGSSSPPQRRTFAAIVRAAATTTREDGGPISAATDTALCLLQASAAASLELWDRREDRRRWRRPVGRPVRALVALDGDGCAVLVGRRLLRYAQDGTIALLSSQARLLARDEEGLLVVVGAGAAARIVAHAPDGRGAPMAVGAAAPGLTALTRTPRYLVLGFRDGNLELVRRVLPSRRGGRDTPPLRTRVARRFEAIPAAAVAHLLAGPGDTIAAGYADGQLRLWQVEEGTVLERAQLHGAITVLERHGRWLVALSELGQSRTLDLGIFERDYCLLLSEVRRAMPFVWRAGLLEAAPSVILPCRPPGATRAVP